MDKIQKITDQRSFTMIYHDFLDCDFLDCYEKIIFIYLKKFTNTNGNCFPSLNTLVRLSGLSKRKIQMILKSLEEKGVLTITQRIGEKGNKSNMYTLYDNAELWKTQKKVSTRNAQKSKQVNTQPKNDNTTLSQKSQVKVQSLEKQRKFENQTSRSSKIELPEVRKSNAINTNNTNTNNNKTENKSCLSCLSKKESQKQDREDKTDIDTYINQIKETINYYDLCICYQYDIELIDSIITIILDVLMNKNKTITIAKEVKSIELVKSVLLKLNFHDIESVIQKYKGVTEKIKKPRQYLLTLLYNTQIEAKASLINQLPLRYR